MGKRAAMATTRGEAQKLTDSELDQHIVAFKYRLGSQSNAGRRKNAERILAMLLAVRDRRNVPKNDLLG